MPDRYQVGFTGPILVLQQGHRVGAIGGRHPAVESLGVAARASAPRARRSATLGWSILVVMVVATPVGRRRFETLPQWRALTRSGSADSGEPAADLRDLPLARRRQLGGARNLLLNLIPVNGSHLGGDPTSHNTC